MKERRLEDQLFSRGELDSLHFFCSEAWTKELRSLTENGDYQKIFGLFPDGICIFDKGGSFVACNEKMLTLYGYTLFQDLQGKGITEFMDAHTLPRVRGESNYLGKRNSPYEGEKNIIRKDGSICTIHRNAHPLQSKDGVFLGTLFYERDITAYKEVSTEFQKLYRAVDQSANAIVITDVHGKIEYVNPKFVEITGYHYVEVSGKNPSILRSGYQDELFYQTLWDTISAGKEWHGKFHNKRKDGSLYWEQASIAPIFNTEGEITHFVGVKEDITDQVEAEERLQTIVEERTRELAIANSQLERRAGEFNILYQVMKSATLSVHLDEILEHTLEAINLSIEPDNIAILLIEKETGKLVIRAYSGFGDGPKLVRRNLGVGIPGIVAQTGETIMLGDVRKHEAYHACDDDALSELCVPLRAGEKVLGALNLESRELGAFDDEDLRLLTILANNLAIVIRNSQLYEAMAQLKEFNENIILTIGEAIVFEDKNGNFIFSNPAAEKLLGYSEQELLGLHWTKIFPKDRHQEIQKEVSTKKLRYYESEVLTKDKRRVPVIISARSLYQHGQFSGILATLIDISQRVETEEKLRQYAMTDSLTGIYNRRYFFEIALQEIERAKRYQHNLSVILFDIDRFKKVNDTYGHGVGDDVLCMICEECNKNLRENDIFARYGGEEFVILLPETPQEQAVFTAERIRKNIAELNIPNNGARISITLSFGVAILNTTSCFDLDEILLCADKALYLAKEQGRNRVVPWEGEDQAPTIA